MDSGLKAKKILLGVTGGIAAYKAAELCRELTKLGAEVRVVMTKGACEFITPLTMQALSGNEVHTSLLDPNAEAGMGHIELAKWPELVLVAPATANFISKYTQGLADDLLSTLMLATTVDIALAPAMNQAMWLHPLTQNNLANLKTIMGKKLFVIGPDHGVQACGDVGPGRLLEPLEIITQLQNYFSEKKTSNSVLCNGRLKGKRIIITAGPTREAIDPVRFISNHSSGKMGYALAQACLEQGADVTVVSGPCSLAQNSDIKFINVQSALQMHDQVHEEIKKGCDIFIGCAAVADYRPINAAGQKIKKNEQSSNELVIRLEENPDIVASVSKLNKKPFTVGFAAETQRVIDYARDKLKRKNLDMIVANDVSKGSQGFNSDYNQVTIISATNQVSLSLEQKDTLAEKIVEHIADHFLK